MNNTYLDGFCSGIIVCIIAAVLFFSFTPNRAKIASQAIEECESTLPRNQNCIIVAVPEEK